MAIPSEIKQKLQSDKFMTKCCVADNDCAGRIEWNHALIFAGKIERAKKYLAHLAKLANHVGLYAEEINPKTKEFLGNFPQAYSHIGFINSAYYLAKNGDTTYN